MYAARFHPYAAPQRQFAAPQRQFPAAQYSYAVPQLPARGIYAAPRAGYVGPMRARGVAAPFLPRPGPAAMAAFRPALPGRGVPRATGTAVAGRGVFPRGGVAPVHQAPAEAKSPLSPAELAAAQAASTTPKSKLNEWMMKMGHNVPYVTVPCPEGGFLSTIELPLDGAGEEGIARGMASSKKVAEQQCADNAMQILMKFGLLDVLCQPSKTGQKKSKGRPQVAPEVLDQMKMVLYDALANAPQSTAKDLVATVSGMGHDWDMNTIKVALHAMEADGTAQSELVTLADTGAVTKRWSVK